jgi:glycosyltransferase involved in cell wall biosynthesis
VTVVSINGEERDVYLLPGLRGIGISYSALTRKRIRTLLQDVQPDCLICRTPHLATLQEAQRANIPTLPTFADIFTSGGFRRWFWNQRIAHVLKDAQTFPCVANHNLNASLSLENVLGISPDRIVPWDWSKLEINFPAKTGRADPDRLSLFYAGSMSVEKGLADCIDAVALLRKKGCPTTLSIAGGGETAIWEARARQAGVSGSVRFWGSLSNAEVCSIMHSHDAVLVPSHHSYAEGLPNTIYEGLASRSALVVSDHPAFRNRLQPDEECLVFRASDPKSLANAIMRLHVEPKLYRRLSENAPSALSRLYVGIDQIALIHLFLNDIENKSGWVRSNSLEILRSLGGVVSER